MLIFRVMFDTNNYYTTKTYTMMKLKLFFPSVNLLLFILLCAGNVSGNTLEQSPKVFNLSTVARNVYALQAKLLGKKIESLDCVGWGKQCDEITVCCGNLVCTDGICLEYVEPR